MGILLIIGIICATIYFICKRSEGRSTPPPLNEGVKAEVCEALNQIFLFRNDNEFWAKESSLLILQPINQDEKLYAQDIVSSFVSFFQKIPVMRQCFENIFLGFFRGDDTTGDIFS